MDTIEMLYLILVLAAFATFIASVGLISERTERYLKQHGRGGQ